MATAADLTIAEVEELVEPGRARSRSHYYAWDLCEPRLLSAQHYVKPIESKFIQSRRCGVTGKERIARRIAREFKDGFYVNLGIGLPTMIAGYMCLRGSM